ncbi:hypothetical protein [Pseudoalteromonas sp. BDTF-M6]|uniref:hypothetical protein n=1 Tax=Pseudoalteromonas sp. BDTF-M6 TaxID=2796132 RepID=UPI001BAEE5CB|nr:hypothetical protein [Pseudoalteromonas sp. BDTF-M6]MBS3797655.1 hypothetical protein [Pseudoalteromonas sp. BDTF-M6]
MTKSTYNPKQVQELGKLITYIARLHRACRDKSQWPSLYPALLALSERLSRLNSQQGSLFHWLLSAELDPLPYATRLHVKRIAALACLVQARQYHAKDCELLMMAALSCDLATIGLLNKRGAGQAFSEREQKQWQQGGLLSLKMLNINTEQQPALVQIVAKNRRYQQVLSSNKHVQLYCGFTRTLALAQHLATLNTSTSTRPGQHFFNACASVFTQSTNEAVQQDCRLLVDCLSPQLLGSLWQRGEQTLVYLGQRQHHEYIFIELGADEHRYRLIPKPQWQYEDTQPHYATLDAFLQHLSAPLQRQSSVAAPQRLPTELLQQVQRAKGYADMERLLSNEPQLQTHVLEAAGAYNRTTQAAANVRHALSMVGLYNIGDFITRVSLSQQVAQLRHPLSGFLLGRINTACAVIQHLSARMKNLYPERLMALYLCYFCYFVEQTPQLLSRSIALDPLKLPFTEQNPRPMAALVGVSQYDHADLAAYLKQHLGDGEWLNALLQSEQQPFNELSTNALVCYSFKLVLFHLYGYDHPYAPWQQQLVKKAMLESQGPSTQLDKLVSETLNIGPYNGI